MPAPRILLKNNQDGLPNVRADNGLNQETIDELRRRTLGMLIAATGHEPGQNPDSVGKRLVNDLAPSAVQLGIGRVDGNELQDALGINEDEGSFGSSQESWGVLNNPHEPFDGVLGNIGMKSVAFAGMATLIATAKLFSVLLSAVNSEFGPSIGLGERSGDGFLRRIGLPKTRYPIADCISRGIEALFGIDTRVSVLADDFSLENVFGAVSGVAKSLLESPGYYANLVRQIGQDTSSLGRLTSTNRSDMPKFLAVATDTLTILEKFSRTPTFRFLVTVIGIGDAALASDERVPTTSRKGPFEDTESVSGSVTRYGSLSRKAGVLVSPTNAVSAAMFNTPESAKKMAQDIGRFNNKYDRSAGRIDAATRQKIEKMINAEYMPCSIVDLRNNTTLSFSGFVSDVRNNFSPEYETYSTLGRNDPVNILKRTTRSIGFSIKLVATSPDDHDWMWNLVNELTMMVYPQYDRGVQIPLEGGKFFTAPLSRVAYGTPLVRVQIGDVIRSNWTDHDANRILGASDRGKAKGGLEFSVDEVSAFVSGKSNKLTGFQNDVRDLGSPSDVGESAVNKLKSAIGLPTNENIEFDLSKYQADYDELTNGKGQISQKVRVLPNGATGYRKEKDGLKSLFKHFGETANKIASVTQAFADDVLKQEEERSGWFTVYQPVQGEIVGKPRGREYPVLVDGGKALIWVPYGMVQPISAPDSLLKETINNFSAATNEESQVYGVESNVFKRSFMNTGGQGVAGVFTSYNVEFSQEALWELEIEGSRAPMAVDISIEMSVVHDINPGLDADGQRIGTIFPVGSQSGGTSASRGDRIPRPKGAAKAIAQATKTARGALP